MLIWHWNTCELGSYDCLYSQTTSVVWDNINGEKIYSNVISLDFTQSMNSRTFNRQEIISNVLYTNSNSNTNNTSRRLSSNSLEVSEEVLSKLNISELDIVSKSI